MSYSFGNSNRNLNSEDVDDYGVDQQMQEQYAPAPEPQYPSNNRASYGGGRGSSRVPAGSSRTPSRVAGPPPRQSASRNGRPPGGESRSGVGDSQMQKVAGEDFTFLVEEGEQCERVELAFGRIDFDATRLFCLSPHIISHQLTTIVFHVLFSLPITNAQTSLLRHKGFQRPS